MAKQKWMPIKGCSNYLVGSLGEIKRIRHRANGKRHKILKEKKIITGYSVYLIGDDGKEKHLSFRKIFIDAFLEKGRTYYKIVPDELVYRVDVFILKETYDRLTYKPTVYKKVRT